MKRVGTYLRVSTNGQTTENQRRELEAVAARCGWQLVGLYADKGISGAKGHDKRPSFDRLKDATPRKINMIAMVGRPRRPQRSRPRRLPE